MGVSGAMAAISAGSSVVGGISSKRAADSAALEILRSNAREMDYQLAVGEFNNEVANLQISDAQEDSRLNAELTRMSGQATGMQLKAEGRASLISGIGAGAKSAYNSGLFE